VLRQPWVSTGVESVGGLDAGNWHPRFASVGAVELRGGHRRPFCMTIVDVFRTFPLVVVSCLIVCPDERAIRTHKDWVVWSRAQAVKGDCTLRGFEQEGKAIFQGKVKRKKREHEAARTEDETENDAPEDEVEGGGPACRQKGWWKRGDVEAKLNTVNMMAWVHKECDIIEEEALTKLQEAWDSSGQKDECIVCLNDLEGA